MPQWLKDHFEILAGAIFGFGGVYVQHQIHGEDIDNIKIKQNKYEQDIAEIKGILQRLDERTKHL